MVTCHFGQVVSVTSSIVKDPMKCSNEVVNNLNDVILYSLTNGILQTKILFTMQRLHYEGKNPQYPRATSSCSRSNQTGKVEPGHHPALPVPWDSRLYSSRTVDTVVLLSSLLTEAEVSWMLLSAVGTLPPTVSSVFLFGLSRIMKHLGRNIHPNKP